MASWSKKSVDRRDWRACNQKLVDRGAFFLDHSIIEKWTGGVDRLNERKYGRLYEFPDELFYWAAMQHVVMGTPYRQIECLKSISRARASRCRIIRRCTRGSSPSNSTWMLALKKKELVVAVDSTGLKVNHRGEWRRLHLGRKRHGWIKLHVCVDKHSGQVLNFRVTGENAHDSELFIPLLKQIADRIGPNHINKVLGDRGYDSKRNYN